MKEKIKVLILKGGQLYERDIENTLENLQDIVGGWIEIPYLSERFADEGIDVIINEEGKIIGLEPEIVLFNKNNNRLLDIVVGKCIFASHDEEGNTIGLNQKQIDVVKEELRREMFLPDGVAKALFI